MHTNHVTSSACVLVLALCGAGCLRDESLDTNRTPLANAGPDQEHEFTGEPIAVELDATKSRDLDGKLDGYLWRPVMLTGDAGMDMVEVVDPDDEAKPEVELGRGTHHFTLWVRDDDGALSEPDTVTIKIGGDPVQECVAAAYEKLDDDCRQCMCNESEACQTAVPACSGDCWGLIGCIAALCPTFTMDMDVSCVTTNCLPFVAEGQTGATAAGACIQPCGEICRASITEIVTSGISM